MFSFVLVIVCDLFVLKRICAGFCYCLFIYVLSLQIRSSYQERRVGIPITGLKTPHLCTCPQPGHGFPTSHNVVFLYTVSQDVDIGVNVDHQ